MLDGESVRGTKSVEVYRRDGMGGRSEPFISRARRPHHVASHDADAPAHGASDTHIAAASERLVFLFVEGNAELDDSTFKLFIMLDVGTAMPAFFARDPTKNRRKVLSRRFRDTPLV